MTFLKKSLALYAGYGVAVLLLFLGTHYSNLPQRSAMSFLAIASMVLILPLLFKDIFGAFCVVLAWLPFSRGTISFELGVITLNPYTMGMILFAILITLWLIIGKIPLLFSLESVTIALLCTIFLYSTSHAANLMESGLLAFHAIFIPIVSYFVIKNIIRNETQYKTAVIFFIAGIILFDFIAIYQYASTFKRYPILSIPPIGVATLNIVAIFYLLYSPLKNSLSGKVALIISLTTIFFTMSRAYIIMLPVSYLLIKIIRKGYSRLLISAILSISFIATLAISYNPNFFYVKPTNEYNLTIQRLFKLDNWKYAMYGRALNYQQGLDNFKKKPITGNGMYKNKITTTTHNLFVEWLEFGGLTGFFLYVGLFILHFSRFRDKARQAPFCAINLLSIIVILTNSVTNGFMHGIMPYMAFILMGLNHAWANIPQDAEKISSG